MLRYAAVKHAGYSPAGSTAVTSRVLQSGTLLTCAGLRASKPRERAGLKP